MPDSFAHNRQNTSLTYTCDNADAPIPIGAPDGAIPCLLQGIDTLEVSYFLDTTTSELDWEKLHYLKVQAGNEKRNRWSEIQLGGIDFHVMPYGSQRYSIILRNQDFTIQLGEKMKPNCLVKFSSQGLWQHGAAQQIANIDVWIRGLGIKPIRPPVVGRVDWAFDFHVPNIDFVSDDFVTRAKKDRVWRSDRREQSFTFGKGDLVVRVYDKVAEIKEESDKAWFFDLWGRKDGVWRIEFQARREHLKTYGIRTPAELFDLQNDVLRQAASKHTTLRQSNGDSNRSRWPTHPLWHALKSTIAAGPQTGLVRSFDPENSEQWKLYQQEKALVGYLKGVAALEAIVLGHESPTELEDFLVRLPNLIEEHVTPQDWLEDVGAKMSVHRMGHR